MLLNQYEIEKYIHASAKRADLRVEWNDRGDVMTDGKTIYLPHITKNTTQEQAEDMIGFVAHEVSHVLHSDFKKLSSVGLDPKRSLLGAIANILEDDGVDAINAAEFFGDRMIRNESHARAVGSIIKNLEQRRASGGGELQKEVEAITTMLTWDLDGKGDYYSNAPTFVPDAEKLLSKQGKEWLDALRKGGYYERLKALRTDESRDRTGKAYEIARDIFENVFKLDPDEEEERCKQRMKEEQSGKGEGKEGEGKKGKGSKSTMGKEGDELAEEFMEFDYRPFMEDQHDEFLSGATISKGSHINYDKWKPSGTNNYTPTPFDKTIVVDYTKNTSNYGHISPMRDGYSSRRDYYRGSHEDKGGEGFANKVRMLLQIRSKGKTQYGTKKGKLHPANTYRVIIKDAPGYSERVFKKKIVSDILDTAVFILGDISGSMSGQKHSHQITAFCQMNDAIGNALKIPLMLAGFTEHDCRNSMFIWRRFDDLNLSRDKLRQRMVHSSNFMHQNCDGDSVLWAYHVLKQRPEKRKVLIVTSDGSPASSKGGDIYGFTKDTVAKIEKSKDVDIVAVGIMDRNVKNLYSQNYTINRADEIEKALLSIIERKVI